MVDTDGGIDQDEAYKDKELMERLYFEEELNQREIADKICSPPTTVNRWMRKHGITLTVAPEDYDIPDEEPWKDEELLRKMYLGDLLSTNDIATLFDCSSATVNKWLNRFGIEKRNRSQALNAVHSGTKEAAAYSMDSDSYMRWTPGDDYMSVHRLMAIAEWGVDAVEGMHVHHKNGLRWDNRIENLELLTNSEHQQKHLKVSGLDRIRVAEMYEHGDISSRDLGDMFDIAGGTVLAIHKEGYDGEKN